jgi:hypothetical protein
MIAGRCKAKDLETEESIVMLDPISEPVLFSFAAEAI